MKYQEYQRILNDTAKNMSKFILMDYREFFGTDDDLFLYQFSTLENPIVKFVDMKKNSKIVFSEFQENNFPIIVCNPMHPSLTGLTIEDKVKIFLKYIPFELFSYVINSTKLFGTVTDEVKEFGSFLNLGFIEIFTEEFCNRHQIEYISQYFPNKVFSSIVLDGISDDIDKKKMVFQNNFLYMLDLYQMSTGKNLFKKYNEEILKDRDVVSLEIFISKYIKQEEQELLKNKIWNDRNYANTVNLLSSYLIKEYKGVELQRSMEELSTLFPNYSIELSRDMTLERKKENGFLVTGVIVASCVLFGILLVLFAR